MRAQYTSLAALAALVLGCQPPAPEIGIGSTTLPAEGPCPTEEQAGAADFTAEVDQLRIAIVGPDIEEKLEAKASVAQLTVDNVPAGENRTVVVYGETAGGTVLWRGMSPDVTVTSGENTALDILLSRVADLSCPRNPMQGAARAFHSATKLVDGRVLIVGGAERDQDASSVAVGATRLLATGTAEIYDPTAGRFTAIGDLTVPRMFHTATLMEDGRVAIVGGTGEALIMPVDTNNQFPISPSAPTSVIEVFDPATNTFSATLDDVVSPRVFHAATRTATGDLVITGGIAAAAGINNLSNALRTTTLCDGALTTCIGGPEMKARRAGHGLFTLDTGDVIAWGGSIETADIDGVGGFKPELLRGNGAAFEMFDLQGFTSNEINLFFPAHSQYVSFRVLAAGGLVRDRSGDFRPAAIDTGDGVARGPVYVLDGGAEDPAAWRISAGPYENNQLIPLAIDSPRFFGAAAALAGGRALLAGGFSSLTFTPASGVDLFNDNPLQVTPIAVGGEARTLRSPRGGLVATAIGDGSILLSGGETVDGAGRAPLTTGEIFMDPEDPLQ
jgi:hypothetical protein